MVYLYSYWKCIRHAQFLVAIYYALGCHTKKDWDLAKRYLHKSAEQDFSRAQADLGIMLVKDHMYVEGLHWLERAEQAVNIYIYLGVCGRDNTDV